MIRAGQVGNAVPVEMAHAIGKVLVESCQEFVAAVDYRGVYALRCAAIVARVCVQCVGGRSGP